MILVKLISCACLVLLLSDCTRSVDQSPSQTSKIIIVHSNDIHGRAWPFKRPDGKWVGGYAAQAHLIAQIRKEAEADKAAFLLLSAGDVNTGVPESDFSEAKPDFEAMRAIGYDALVVGNHDFDHGIELLQKQFSWVNFPFLGANLKLKKSGNPLFPGQTKLIRNGIQFGILGVTTDELPRLIFPEHAKKLTVTDSIAAAKEGVAQLKKEGSEILIALSHLGLSATGLSLHRLIPKDDRILAKAVPELHLIIGGHSHTFLEKGLQEGSTLIAQAGYRGEYLGRVDLLWDTERKKVLSSKAQLIEVDPSKGEDFVIKSLVEPFRKKYEEDLGVVVFETKEPVLGLRNQTGTLEIPLGNLICDALRFVTKTELAFFNTGGLRSSLPAGSVRKRDVLEAFPFQNRVTTGSLKGAEVISLLNDGLRGGDFSGGVLQVSGLTYEILEGKAVNVKIGNKPISTAQTYTFSTNSYVASAGDKLKTMRKAQSLKNHKTTIDESLILYGKEHGKLEAQLEKRIQLIDLHKPL